MTMSARMNKLRIENSINFWWLSLVIARLITSCSFALWTSSNEQDERWTDSRTVYLLLPCWAYQWSRWKRDLPKRILSQKSQPALQVSASLNKRRTSISNADTVHTEIQVRRDIPPALILMDSLYSISPPETAEESIPVDFEVLLRTIVHQLPQSHVRRSAGVVVAMICFVHSVRLKYATSIVMKRSPSPLYLFPHGPFLEFFAHLPPADVVRCARRLSTGVG